MIDGTTSTDHVQDSGIVDMGYHYDDSPAGMFLLSVEGYPLHAGQSATFAVTDGQSNKNTWLVYSLTGLGSTYVPPLYVSLDLANPALALSGTTGGYGSISWSPLIPNNVPPGLNVWLQAVQIGQVTNIVATTVQ